MVAPIAESTSDIEFSLSSLSLQDCEAGIVKCDEIQQQVMEQLYVRKGMFLARIAQGKLYRESGYSTFEEYCEKRWGWSRDVGYRYIRAAGVVQNVESTLQTTPTLTQAVELAPLPPDQQRELAAKIDFSTATVKDVREAVKEMRQQSEPENPQPETQPEPASKLAVHFSSESPEWYTPPEVLECVNAAIGDIDLDPCCNTIGEPNVKAKAYLREADNGLDVPWFGRVYMNPPYGRGIDAWVEKLVHEHVSGNVPEAVALVPARVDTDWFRMFRDYAICFVDGRLKFSGHENSAPFPSAVVYLGGNIDGFYEAFKGLGDIWIRWQK